MKCRVDGCDNEAMYKAKQLCQKHYFREMRNGTTEILNRKRKDKCLDGQGYVMLYKPNHPIATKNGLIREHRYVAYEKYKDKEIMANEVKRKKEYENKKVLVGYNGSDEKEVTMTKLKENINEIRDNRSTFKK